jgi:membrane protease YdiL (CAAX protease family)
MPSPAHLPVANPYFWISVGFGAICAASLFLWIANLPRKVPASGSGSWSFPDLGWLDAATFLALCYLAVFLSITLAQLLSKAFNIGDTEFAILANFSMQGSLLLSMAYLGKKLPTTYGTPHTRPDALPIRKAILHAIFAFVKFLPLIWVVNSLSQHFLESLGAEIDQQEPVKQILSALQGSPLKFAALAFGAVVLAPIAEELLFRGFLYRYFLNKMTMLQAAVLSSVLFAAIHMHIASFLPLFCLGFLFAHAYQATGNIVAPIFFHGLFNATTISLMLLTPWMPEAQ